MISSKLLLVPGLPRCATTSLVNILQQSPHIEVGKNKEPHYFLTHKTSKYSFDGRGRKVPLKNSGYNLTKDSFVKNYGRYSEYTLDGSTLYSVDENCLDKIDDSKLFTEVKAIVSFRSSLSRAYSHYTFSKSRGEEFRTFAEALEDELSGQTSNWVLKGYIAGSRIKPFVSYFSRKYGKANIYIIDLDRITLTEESNILSICQFLNIPIFPFNKEIYNNKNIDISNTSLVRIRTAMKKFRQLNPNLTENKLTRSVFNYIMSKFPKEAPTTVLDLDLKLEFKACFESIDIENKRIFKEFNRENCSTSSQ